jgi:ubiquinol-cytochrome c reductase cytochrome c subunit
MDAAERARGADPWWPRALLPLLLVAGCVAVATLLVDGHAAAAPQAANPPARATYLSDCAVCHGADATGTEQGPPLVGVGTAVVDFELSTGRMPLADASRTEEPGRTKRPAPNRTPAATDQAPARHAPAYSPMQEKALVAYIATLIGPGGPQIPTLPEGDLAQGGELYRLNCAACHAWAGSGGALAEREAPNLYQATALQTAEAIRVGPGRMPAFGQAALSTKQVGDVAAYVEELRHPADRGGLSLAHLGPVGEGAAAGVALIALLLVVRVIGERG